MPRVRNEHPRDRAQNYVGSGSLTGLGVYAVTIGVTVILALGETFFFGGRPGVITGLGLVHVPEVLEYLRDIGQDETKGIKAVIGPENERAAKDHVLPEKALG
jgi:hypothetical protein